MKSPLGTHLIVDAWAIAPERLDDEELMRTALQDAVRAVHATLIELCVHRFSPHGLTATATLAESHIAVHTWPEHGFLAMDIFFCGTHNPQAAVESLCDSLQITELEIKRIERGVLDAVTADPSHP